MKPDYTNVAIARSTGIIQQAFAWMFGGLLVTGVTAMAAASDAGFQQTLAQNPAILIVLFLAEIGLVIGISAGLQRMSHAVAVGAFLLYAALNGVVFSFILLAYTGGTIYGAFFATSMIFGVMAVYGFVTKSDLSGAGSIAFMLLIGVILVSIVNFFLHVQGLSLILSYAIVGIFCALTAYDTQKLKMLSTQMEGGNLGIYGALSLYLDFINIFLALLRIFGGGRR